MASPPPLPNRDNWKTDSRYHAIGLAILLLIVAVALALSSPFENGDSSDGVGSTRDAVVAASQKEGKSAANAGGVDGAHDSGHGASSHEDLAGDASGNGAHDVTSPEYTATETISQTEGDDGITQTLPTSGEGSAAVEPPPDDTGKVNSFFTLGQSAPANASHRSSNTGSGKSSAKFFGVEAKGKRFVYVVDVSSSMSGMKFEKARQELIDSIEELDRDTYFFVTFFNDVPFYQPIDRLIAAHGNNKKRVKSWISQAVPSGGTSPSEAVAHAIRLRPDAIFLLSDGEFDLSEVFSIRSANARFHVSINTIGFQTDAQTLKTIAEENQGKYRFVP